MDSGMDPFFSAQPAGMDLDGGMAPAPLSFYEVMPSRLSHFQILYIQNFSFPPPPPPTPLLYSCSFASVS